MVILRYVLGKSYMDRKERKNKQEGIGSHDQRHIEWWWEDQLYLQAGPGSR